MKPDYKNVCPFPTRPIKELFVTENHLDEIFYCDNYNGKFQSCPVRKGIPKNCTQQHNKLQPLYNGALAINSKKYNDIQSLVRFCSCKSADYFTNLCHVNQDVTDDEYNNDNDLDID